MPTKGDVNICHIRLTFKFQIIFQATFDVLVFCQSLVLVVVVFITLTSILVAVFLDRPAVLEPGGELPLLARLPGHLVDELHHLGLLVLLALLLLHLLHLKVVLGHPERPGPAQLLRGQVTGAATRRLLHALS